ncbi:hypothetical protein CPAR01_07075 [Colletotrichum paranaense]|uniref:Uncharacterized protein n=1 Tax=Colletotrichum paranaense TaxID=1914294 RepID=A0ABQ9SPU1_9PEZI|nr:uncharacterized protein CPAR01_07075 [Colletotrichum paranaense]KAK1541086.1 hypothetical protein CPAR01_07075 [Colletotrichum paranaense]
MHPYLHSAFLYLLARLRGEALHRIAGFTRAGIAFLRDASGHELESSGLEDQVTLRMNVAYIVGLRGFKGCSYMYQWVWTARHNICRYFPLRISPQWL